MTKSPRKKKKPMEVRNSPQLVMAIKAVKTGGMSIPKAAKKYGIGRSSLQRYVKGEYKGIMKNTLKKNHANSYMTADEERTLVVNLQLLGMLQLDMGIGELLQIAGRIVREKLNDPNHPNPSKNWARRFQRRHKVELSLRKAINIKTKRAANNARVIQEYHDHLTKTLEGVPPENILNYDETNFT